MDLKQIKQVCICARVGPGVVFFLTHFLVVHVRNVGFV